MNWKCQLVLPSLSKCNHVFSCLKLCRNTDETFCYEASLQLLNYFFSSSGKKEHILIWKMQLVSLISFKCMNGWVFWCENQSR